MFRVMSFVFVLLFVFFGQSFADNKRTVFVSIVPQKFFVQQICKDKVDVQIMVLPGASPATYEPKPQQMAALSRASHYFALGAPFENFWLAKISAANPAMQVVHTDEGIKKRSMATHHHDEDEHVEAHHEDKHAEEHHESGNGHAKGHKEADHAEKDHHDRAGHDPHVWLSPPLVKLQTRAIFEAISEADPANRTFYETNFNAFMAQIDQLDADLKKTFSGKAGLQFMVFHPSWGYFADAYGLKQVAIEIEGKDPKPAQLKELIQHARERGIKVIFVQPEFSTKSAELVAREIGGQVIYAAPLAEDWLNNLRQVADKFSQALR